MIVFEYLVSLVIFVIGLWFVCGLTYLFFSAMYALCKDFQNGFFTFEDLMSLILCLALFAGIAAGLYYGTTMTHGALYANNLQIPFI